MIVGAHYLEYHQPFSAFFFTFRHLRRSNGNVSRKTSKGHLYDTILDRESCFDSISLAFLLISSTVSTATVYDDVMLSCDIDAVPGLEKRPLGPAYLSILSLLRSKLKSCKVPGKYCQHISLYVLRSRAPAVIPGLPSLSVCLFHSTPLTASSDGGRG